MGAPLPAEPGVGLRAKHRARGSPPRGDESGKGWSVPSPVQMPLRLLASSPPRQPRSLQPVFQSLSPFPGRLAPSFLPEAGCVPPFLTFLPLPCKAFRRVGRGEGG